MDPCTVAVRLQLDAMRPSTWQAAAQVSAEMQRRRRASRERMVRAAGAIVELSESGVRRFADAQRGEKTWHR